MKNHLLNSLVALLLFASPSLASPYPLPTQVEADRQQSWALVKAGEALLQAGDFSGAEADFRTALVLWPGDVAADPGLAEALSSQGKNAKSLAIYRRLFYEYPRNMNSVAEDARNQMNYAILLCQVGQWPEAVTVYEKAAPIIPDNELLLTESQFDPAIPMPAKLQALAHIARGLRYSGYGESTKALNEFEKAALIAPESGVVNYYYGYGLRYYDPASEAKAGKANAAFAKAAKLGKGEVKKAAQKALLMAMKTR